MEAMQTDMAQRRENLAGLQAGLFSDLSDLADRWRLERRFEAQWDSAQIDDRYKGWQRAVQAVRQFAE